MKKSKLFYTTIGNKRYDIMAPSSMVGSINNIHSKNSGRSEETGKYNGKKLAIKDKYELAWNGIKPEDAADIIKAFGLRDVKVNYVNLHIVDIETNQMKTFKVYTGDSNYEYGPFSEDSIHYYQKLSFNVIEV